MLARRATAAPPVSRLRTRVAKRSQRRTALSSLPRLPRGCPPRGRLPPLARSARFARSIPERKRPMRSPVLALAFASCPVLAAIGAIYAPVCTGVLLFRFVGAVGIAFVGIAFGADRARPRRLPRPVPAPVCPESPAPQPAPAPLPFGPVPAPLALAPLAEIVLAPSHSRPPPPAVPRLPHAALR